MIAKNARKARRFFWFGTIIGLSQFPMASIYIDGTFGGAAFAAFSVIMGCVCIHTAVNFAIAFHKYRRAIRRLEEALNNTPKFPVRPRFPWS